MVSMNRKYENGKYKNGKYETNGWIRNFSPFSNGSLFPHR